MPAQTFLGDNVTILRLAVPDASVQLTVTSPPYDNLRTYNGFTWDFESLAQELYRVTKPGGVVVWVVADATVNGSKTGTSFRQALYFRDTCGFNLHDTMIWNKLAFSAVGALVSRYAPVFEYMFVFSKDSPKTFNPIKDHKNISNGIPYHGTIRTADGKTRPISNIGKLISEFGHRFNVWEMAAEKNRNIKHPAPFPEALARDHILSWSNPGDTVLDPFLGSGTTGKMAVELGREFIGIEISEEYLKIAQTRITIAEYEKACR